MKWQNLQDNKCPYCADALELQPDGKTINCLDCAFTISKDRFVSIRDHRKQVPVSYTKIKWQHLKQSRCPICANDLIETRGPYEILKCISIMCVFHIRADRMAEILADPSHAANRYNQ